jgi:hypothetical protein
MSAHVRHNSGNDEWYTPDYLIAIAHAVMGETGDVPPRFYLRKTYTLAEKAGDLGLANFLQDRMSAHRKWQWQLRSTLQWMEA